MKNPVGFYQGYSMLLEMLQQWPHSAEGKQNLILSPFPIRRVQVLGPDPGHLDQGPLLIVSSSAIGWSAERLG